MGNDDFIILGMILLIVGTVLGLGFATVTILMFVPAKALPFVGALLGLGVAVLGYSIARNHGAFD